MIPVLRIIYDVLSFRLRRLEMANMVSAVAIMAALRVPVVWEGIVRLAFAVALNVLVYLNNDYHDLEEDLAAEGRERQHTRYLAQHRRSGLAAQLLLAGTLLGVAFAWGGGLWRPLVLGGGVCWLYSMALKRRPVVDVVAMMIWGVTMPMVGVVEDSLVSWLLLAQLGAFSGVFESIQVLRDRAEDELAGVKTSAVVFGAGAIKIWIRVALVGNAALAGLAFHPALAAGPAWVALMPPSESHASRYWNLVRLALGLTFLAECALVYAGVAPR